MGNTNIGRNVNQLELIGSIIPFDQVILLLQDSFGNKVELAGIKIANQQHDYLVLIAGLHRPHLKVVIKLAGPDSLMASAFDRTVMLQRLVASNTTIPMPEIFAVNTSFQVSHWRYLIRRYIPGHEWMGIRKSLCSEQLSDALRQIGNAVAQLHSINFPIFGELQSDGNVHGYAQFLTALKQRAKNSIKSGTLCNLFISFLENQKDLFLDVTGPCLCHEDLHGHNIIFHVQHGRWQLASILDFDKAWSGHHEIDLARMDFWRGMIGDAFWTEYLAIRHLDPQYALRRPIYQLLWCFEYARQTRQHLNDTHQLCAKLGLPAIKNFD